ncbi:MAG: hypothetical protein K6T34_01690 [Thermoflavifilum sp.]|nr:hypothetical protein [Thermoflavifilum sp.]
MATIQRETLAPLHEKIVVQIAQEDYMPAFEKTLKEYRKKAQIPGFRKGMVPVSLIRKMYGQAIFTEEVIRMAEQQLNHYLEEQKLDIFSQPLWLEKEAPMLDLDAPAEYVFAFEIGLRPQIELNLLQPGTILEKWTVEVTDQMVADEIEYLLRRYASKENIEQIEQDDDYALALFEQVDANGEPIANGLSRELTLLLREIQEGHRQDWMGKRVNDVLVKTLPEIFSGDSLSFYQDKLGIQKDDTQATSYRFRITLKELGRLKRPALEPTFFHQVFPGEDVETAEAFQQRVREEVEYYYHEIAQERLRTTLMEKLIHETEIPLPEEFLRHLLARNQSANDTTVDDQALSAFLHELRWTLIVRKLEELSGVKVTEEDILRKANADFAQYFNVYSQKKMPEYLNGIALQLLQNEKTYEKYALAARNEKLLDWALTQITVQEVPLSLEDFKARLEQTLSHQHQHNHEHEHEHA